MNPKVLIIDDEESIIYSIKGILALDNFDTFHASNGKEGLKEFSRVQPDLVIADFQMPEMTGLELIKAIKSISPDTPIIIVTAYGDKELNYSFVKEGAFSYIEKPFDIEELRLKTIEGINHYKSIKKPKPIIGTQPEPPKDFNNMIGNSQALQDILNTAKKLAQTDISILIEGESGTGKELMASYIHHHSLFHKGPLIKFNGSALPETLIESELFGYEKGAFTGADNTKIGRFEQAQNGSIFIDEVAELPLSIQAKLLRVLQEKEFERLGGHETIQCSTRIISATNKNLAEQVKLGLFREDLYYRLAGFPIEMPPLRERKEDIEAISIYIVSNLSKKFHKELPTLSKELIEKLKQHNWPGNIRELQNMLSRSFILSNKPILEAEDIQFKKQSSQVCLFDYAIKNNFTEQDLIKEYAKKVYAHFNYSKGKTTSFLNLNYKTLQKRLEEEHIFEACDNNQIFQEEF